MNAVFKDYQIIKMDLDTSVLEDGMNEIGLSIQTGINTEKHNGENQLTVRFNIQYLCHKNKKNIFSIVELIKFDLLDGEQFDPENDTIDQAIIREAYEKVKDCIGSIMNTINVGMPAFPDFDEFISA